MHTGATRTVALVMELLGPAQAMRKAERAATEAGAERALRARIGKRTSARERQRETGVATREEELASGHAAVRFAGYVTVSVPEHGPGGSLGARDDRAQGGDGGQQPAAAPRAHVGPAGRGPHLHAPAMSRPGMSNPRPLESTWRRRRILRAERRHRMRGFARERSQPPQLRLRRVVRPAERPGHIATTAHVQAAYPFVAEAGLGTRGVLIGRDVYGGPFVIDPWLLYQEGRLHDPNMLILGRHGLRQERADEDARASASGCSAAASR